MNGTPRRIYASSRSRQKSVIKAFIVLASATILFLLLMDGVRAAATDAVMEVAPPVGRESLDRGGLYFPQKDGELFQPAPVLETDIRGRISGMVGRFTIRHTFQNPGDDWVEGIYVFPLPPNAAVDSLKMRIGGRVIEGEIQEKTQAKRTYTDAKKSGRKASLVEQERPNIFTASIANIGPGEEVSVEIEYQQTLRYDGGAFDLRLPLVIGPRYIPGSRPVAGFGGIGWGVNTAQVPDADRITPPVREIDGATDSRRGNRVSLSIVLDAGFPLGVVESPSHPITVAEEDGGKRRIILDGGGPRPLHRADRDFKLRWTPAAGQAPSAGLFTEIVDGETYALLMLMPPTTQAADGPSVRRELIFVIDTSGSMHGASMEQAKTALGLALDRLKPTDRFNIIRFSNRTSRLFPAARAAVGDAIRRAHDYVNAMTGEGGTEILPAIEVALDGGTDKNRIRQVVLLTDGAIGNEEALFTHIADNLGDSRLFTVGIGAAPNGHFMTRAAAHGRGTYTYISKGTDVRARMEDLFRKLERPALTHIRLAWPDGAAVEAWPNPVPDLYMGEPLVIAARMGKLDGTVTVSGRLGGADWRMEAPLARVDGDGKDNPGIGRLWARAKIAALTASLRTGADAAEVRGRIVKTALTHSLVSRYTSLVAVDVSPSRPVDAPLATRPVPTEMPDGWSRDHVFGGAGLKKAGGPAMAPARVPVRIGVPLREASVRLPQTATPAGLHLMVGMTVLLLALSLILWGRRRA